MPCHSTATNLPVLPACTACRDYYDISVAVSTPKGLVVPVLRNVDQMSFADVEKVRVQWAAAWLSGVGWVGG